MHKYETGNHEAETDAILLRKLKELPKCTGKN
jgi:hypothetical protein